MSHSTDDARRLLDHLFRAAVDRARPDTSLAGHLPPKPKGRTVVIGAGKASAAMARALEAAWDGPLEGVVLTRTGHGEDTRQIRIVEASHPVPDQAGVDGTAEMLACLDGLTEADLVICLLSGGGSALLAGPPPGVSLEDLQALSRALLRSGAPISDMNTVRKHVSTVAGGRLALAAAPAPIVTLAISDVPGDDPAVIASGPTVADATTAADARAILEAHGIAVPASITHWLTDPAAETPKPDDPALAHASCRLIATPMMSLEAAAALAEEKGIRTLVLGDRIEGEAREVAKVLAAIAISCATHARPLSAPCLILSGGETTVTVRGNGRGGRNTEFQLALALALDGHPGISAIAGDTDGIDGSEDNAGALVDPTTLARARAAGLDPRAFLADNDGYGFFSVLGDLVVTGPTRTNVNDFRAILIT
ncbi:glycerate kinase type-2 family protein [Amorphus orientalis]|uniref:Hydroxypyruvate reductase n=1 Tax=Amorphus orientalis TaxID=649198 RepID=A0AAE3VPD8_9HYPH|nr:glycerate kinase [Amorphus orientalis]MDQ0316374.1 hydroxypyruvate reductase [Amorphus orientalis]